jgi:hypothetical protein
MALSSRRLAVALLIAAIAGTSFAHEHHDDAIPEGEVISPDPLVSWKWILAYSRGVDAYGDDRILYYGYILLYKCLRSVLSFPLEWY